MKDRAAMEQLSTWPRLTSLFSTEVRKGQSVVSGWLCTIVACRLKETQPCCIFSLQNSTQKSHLRLIEVRFRRTNNKYWDLSRIITVKPALLFQLIEYACSAFPLSKKDLISVVRSQRPTEHLIPIADTFNHTQLQNRFNLNLHVHAWYAQLADLNASPHWAMIRHVKSHPVDDQLCRAIDICVVGTHRHDVTP
jgi:hypothetical protein